jgi:DNA-binding phage protein
MKAEYDFSKAQRGRFYRKSAVPLTVSFDEIVRALAARDPAFKAALFGGAVQSLLSGDVATANAALHAYIKATIGYAKLGAATGISVKSLMRMFGPNGNPTAIDLFAVIGILQKRPASVSKSARSRRQRKAP